MTTSTEIRSGRAQRRAARRSSHHLVTADENSLVELETFLATLPLCASGRVFIEVPEQSDIAPVTAPPRMTVTWLVRAGRTGAPGSGRACTPGTAVARATRAWADEMLCGDDVPTHITLLGGYMGTADIVEHLVDDLEVPATAIRVPERFGLLPADR